MTYIAPFDTGDLIARRARIHNGDVAGPASRSGSGLAQVKLGMRPLEHTAEFEGVRDDNPCPFPLLPLSVPGNRPERQSVPASLACGVMQQGALRPAPLRFAITHRSGKTVVREDPASCVKILNVAP